jgi:hypothetical protein
MLLAGALTVRAVTRRLCILLRASSFMIIALTPVVAQQGDPNAVFKQYDQLYSAGNYSAAFVEAQKFEAGL